MECTKYNEKIDIWSLGCIFADLIRLKPLFPGKDKRNQLIKIFEVFGGPEEEFVDKMNFTASFKEY